MATRANGKIAGEDIRRLGSVYMVLADDMGSEVITVSANVLLKHSSSLIGPYCHWHG